MEFLKELFTQPLSYEDFEKAVNAKGFKIADLSKGEYVAKGKFDDLQNKNKALNEQITTLNADMQALKDNNATAEDYKAKFEKLNADIAQQKAEAEKAAADKELTDKITALFPTDKEFTSDYVKNGLIADIKAKFAEDSTKGLEAYFTELTKDKEGIFKAHNNAAMSGMGNFDSSTIDESKIRSIMGLK